RPRSANASTLRVPIAGSRALPSRADTGTRLGPDLLPQPGGFEGFLRIKECLRPHDPAVPHVENGEGPPADRHAAGLPEATPDPFREDNVTAGREARRLEPDTAGLAQVRHGAVAARQMS